MHRKYEDYADAFEAIYNPDYEGHNAEKIKNYFANLLKAVTSIADYVWLPFRFEGEIAYLDWKDAFPSASYITER